MSSGCLLVDPNGQNVGLCTIDFQKNFGFDPTVNKLDRRNCYWGLWVGKAVIFGWCFGRVFCLCFVLLGCDSLCCVNVVLLGCCGSLGGLMGTRCWEKRGYGLRGSTWAQLEVGNRGWWVYARIVDVENLLCTIARPPPSTTCDGYPIILQAWDEEV